MGSPLPPDPYLALGVPKDATTAAIKAAHRKLVLKCHPDKVADPAAKQAASDQFHVIQSAYEILADEDRRGRYDAQVRLADLRRQKMERERNQPARGYDSRPAAPTYMTSHDSANSRDAAYSRSEQYAPQYEVRQPPNVKADYPEPQPRATPRREYRDDDYERPSRKTQDVREKTRAFVREAVRHDRKERQRKTETAIHRERDRKSSYAEPETDSDSDEYARRTRRMQEEDRERREDDRERRAAREARDSYYEQARRQREEAANGHFADERARKMFSQTGDARDYIQSSRSGRSKADPERRPSTTRVASDRDRDQPARRGDRPQAPVRQSSSRPQTSGRDADPQRRYERRSSAEYDDQPRQPPAFVSSKSSPADIKIPTDKQRSYSLQPESDAMPEISQVKRAETMPVRRSDDAVPTRATYTRSTEVNDGMPSPGATPEYTGPAGATRYHYGKQYADDANFIKTPDGFMQAQDIRTEYRTPDNAQQQQPQRPAYVRKVTRSPSPVREPRDSRDARDRPRTTSRYEPATSRPTPQLARHTSSRSYHYPSAQVVGDSYDRQRTSSARANEKLFGEVGVQEIRPDRPATDSPRQASGPFPLPGSKPDHRDDDYHTRSIRPGTARVSSGHSKRTTVDRGRPSMGRSASHMVYGRA